MSSDSKGTGTARPVDAVALARTRRRLEQDAQVPWLHAEVSRRMAERLPLFKHKPGLVLDVWPGPGGSGPALKAALPQARVECLVAPATSASAVLPWWSPRRWSPGRLQVQERDLQAGRYELVWANMLLQHLPDPPVQFAQWHRLLALGGYLMFSTLGPGTLGRLRALYRERGWGSPMAELVDMHDLGDQLVQAGFGDPVMDQETIRLTWSKADDAITELRSIGSNTDPVRASGLCTPGWRRRLFEALAADAVRTASGRVELEFELVYGHAFKASLGVKEGGQTRIGLEEMRQSLRAGRSRPPG